MATYYPVGSLGDFKNFFKKVIQDELLATVAQPVNIPEDIEGPAQAEVAISEQPTSSNSGKKAALPKKPFMTSYRQHQWLRQ